MVQSCAVMRLSSFPTAILKTQNEPTGQPMSSATLKRPKRAAATDGTTEPRDALNGMSCRERFLLACRCLPVDRPPVWLMRQAGRALPEYRKLKQKYSFLELVQNPEL